MPGADTSAATAARAAKRAKGKGRLGRNRIQRLERELRKKQKEETAAEAALAAAAAEEAADAGPAARATRAAAARATRAAAAAETAVAAAAVAAASAPSERHAASGHLGNEAQINGTVKRVKPSRGDEAAHREAKLVLTLEQVALQEMREQGRGWVCALCVGERLHVYLAGDLAGENPVIRKVVVGGGKEGAHVRMDVDKDRLESQPMVVMEEQKFFYVDTAGLGPFDGVGKGRGEGDCGCCTEKQQPDVRCRRSSWVTPTLDGTGL